MVVLEGCRSVPADRDSSYVLITPARNEEAYIEKTISSVISQTIQPKKWIIVNDGSEDKTDAIVRSFASHNGFIDLEVRESGNKRDFASKVSAFNQGYAKIRNLDYAFIGNLDADVSFKPDYFERVIGQFHDNPALGIAGGWIWEPQGGIFFERSANTTRSVPGAIQLFRRKCFEDIGGYIPVAKGGIDTVAEIKAVWSGWMIQAYPQIPVMHYRRTSAGKKNVLLTRFRQGEIDYILSSHIVFQLFKTMYRFKEKPYVLGGLLRLSGYGWACINREQRIFNESIVSDLQARQMTRVKRELLNIVAGVKK